MQLINGRQELLKVQEMPSLCRSHSYLQQVLLTHLSRRYISSCLQLLTLDFKHPTHATVVALARFSPFLIVSTVPATRHATQNETTGCLSFCCASAMLPCMLQSGSGDFRTPTVRVVHLLLVVYVYDLHLDTFKKLPDMPANLPVQIHNACKALRVIEQGTCAA